MLRYEGMLTTIKVFPSRCNPEFEWIKVILSYYLSDLGGVDST